MPDDDEKKFQAWYARIVKRLNKGIKDEKDWVISDEPDDWQHYYDYRAAFKAGAEPKYDEKDKHWHWPSKYKHDLHRNRFIRSDGKWLDTKYDKIVDLRAVEDQKTNREIYEKRKNAVQE